MKSPKALSKKYHSCKHGVVSKGVGTVSIWSSCYPRVWKAGVHGEPGGRVWWVVVDAGAVGIAAESDGQARRRCVGGAGAHRLADAAVAAVGGGAEPQVPGAAPTVGTPSRNS